MPLTSLRGHREIYERLAAELRTRPSHAYLFSGPRGIGKSLVARSLVHGFTCERKGGVDFCCAPNRCPVRSEVPQDTGTRRKAGATVAPRCDCCAGCVQTASNVHPDVSHVTRAANRTDVLIEQVREMIGQLSLRPVRAPMRLAILDDAETLNIPAQNALLKTLEEPPGHAILFLIASSERALLDTVRSRLRLVHFAPLTPTDIEAVLADRGDIDATQAGAISRLARGSVGRAIELAQGAEPPLKPILEALARVESLDLTQTQALAQEFFGNREQAASNFELIARLLEEILCNKLLPTASVAGANEFGGLMKKVGDSMRVEALAMAMRSAVRGHKAVDEMANSRLQGEQFWISVTQAAKAS